MKKESNPVLTARDARGLTQQQMADALGVAKNYVYLLESGRKPITKSILDRLTNLGPESNCHLLVKKVNNECRLCEEKDREIEWLRTQLSKAQDNLSSALSLKPTVPAPPVCGALDDKTKNERRGA